MRWCSVDIKGEIRQVGECPDGTPKSAFDHIAGEKLFEILGDIGFSTHYYKGGQFIPYGIKPSDFYSWDWVVCDWVADTALAEKLAREERAIKLAQSDWTQLPDVPLATKTAWATYRQALRDITHQPDFPNNIIWPNNPT